MQKTTDIAARLLNALEHARTADVGLTVKELATKLQESARTVRTALDTLVAQNDVAREYAYKGTPPIGAYRYFQGRAPAPRKNRTPRQPKLTGGLGT